MPPLATNAVITLPPGAATRYREKIRYFEADLRLDPGNEALLARLAQTYAALALTLRDDQPAEAKEAFTRARGIARRRQKAYPRSFPVLDMTHDDLDRLTWAAEGSGLMLPQMMGASPMQGLPTTPMMSAPGMAGGTPGLSGMPRMSNGPTGTVLGNSPGGIVQAPMPPIQTQAQSRTRLDPEEYFRTTIAACLAKRREDPNDIKNLDALGTTYQRMAGLEQDPEKRKANTYLKMALEVFRDAARRSRLRIHKASFFRAAGDVYGALGDTMNQYRMAKLATEQTPFAPSVWEELQDAALRAGRFSDSRTAARKAREWSLPAVRGNAFMAGPTGLGPAGGSPRY